MTIFHKPLFLLALLPLFLLYACKDLPNYKITNQNEDFTEVEIETRLAIDDLYAIAKAVKPEGKNPTLMVFFNLPSEYPGADSPWAQVTFTRLSETREVSSLSVYGACTDAHRDSLLGITPGPEYTLLGKWHHRDPVLEAVYIIKQKDTAFVVERHFAGKYLETEHKPLPVCGVWADDRGVHHMKAPAFEELLPIDLPLTRIDAQTYVQKDGSEGYRILPNGNLQRLNEKGQELGEIVKVGK